MITPVPPPRPAGDTKTRRTAAAVRGARTPWRTWLAALALAAVGLCLQSAPRAEPRFAVREGLQCADCHINQTGGGMRTAFGRAFSQTNLDTFGLRGIADPRAGDSVTFGGNLRLANRSLFPAHTEIDGARRRAGPENSFDMSEGNLYFRADLVPSHVAFYIDETMAPEGASNREAYLLVEGLPGRGWVKAGRFLLPYGLRFPDDTMFIRQQTGFTYANQDLGVEVGFAPGPIVASVAVSNGSLGGGDGNLAKQVTGQVAFVHDWLRLGASIAWNDTSTAGFDFHSLTFGGHIGARLGRLITLAELDWIHSVNASTSWDQWALYAGADLEVRKGLYLRGAFEAFDPLRSLRQNERDRFVVGASWFAVPWLELRGEYRINRDIPQRVEGNGDEMLLELHTFL